MSFPIKQAFADRTRFWAGIALLVGTVPRTVRTRLMAGTVPRTVRGRLGEVSLPINAQRPTLNAQGPGPLRLRASALKIPGQRPTLELPNFRTPELPRSGMTMIELVASLALFVVILGVLMTVLNSATDMWSNSRSQKREQTVAENITDLIADDLYQAVTSGTNDYPIFILEPLPPRPDPGKVYTILGLVRYASVHSPVPLSETRRSIDAVFYTYYDNALLRHVFPIETSGFKTSESIGKLVDVHKNKLTEKQHDKILEFNRNKPGATYPDVWQWQLLAERADIIIAATLPRTLIRMDDPGKYPNALPSAPDPDPDLYLPPLPVSRLYSDVLPDQVDIRELRLCDQQDWAAYEPLRDKNTPKDRYLKAPLGTLVSRRITLPQAGGSRLP